MNTTLRLCVPCVAVAVGLLPLASSAQSLSAGLGATKLDGLTNFADCQNQTIGYREHLIADRLDARLAQSPALTKEQRDVWVAEVAAMRAVTPKTPKYTAPDPKDSQRYLGALTGPEQQSINSMTNRNNQEIQLLCEQKYGGMTRYSPGSDQSGQKKYEQGLRDKFVTPIDIATVAVTPLPSPFPKTDAEVKAERQANRNAQRQAQNTAVQGMQAKMMQCQAESKGLRLSMTADMMQRDLDKASGLSAKDRADFAADIKATRDAATKGLDVPEPVDPANPYRGMMRLSQQENVDLGTQFGTQFSAALQACMAKAK